MTQSIAIESGGSDLEGSERERIIRKIKRCLALGGSTNKNEAEMAMRQAQAMMRSYRLSEADIHAESVGCTEHDTGLIRMSDWQRGLANTAAQAFNCKMLMRHCTGHPVKFMFVGVMPAAELAAYAYDSLLVQVKTARKRFQGQYGANRRAADDFCLAWVYSVKTKVVMFAQEFPDQATQANALVLVEKQEHAAIDAWIARQEGEVKTRKQVKRDHYDTNAIQLGRKAGEQAVINQGVAGSNAQLMLG